MSVNNPGQFAAYTPPPPPPSSPRSPWLYISLGCGALILLSFGGCVIAGGLLVNKMKTVIAKPLNVDDLNKGLGDTPRYPNAKLDESGTKVARMLEPLMTRAVVHGQSFAIAAYRTPDPIDKVVSYYYSALTAAGYEERHGQQPMQHIYQKGTEVVFLQEQTAQSTDKDGIQFFVIRFHGAKIL